MKKLIGLCLLIISACAFANETGIPSGYKKYQGTWRSPMGNNGSMTVYVDNLENPKTVYVIKSGGACAYNPVPLTPVKTDTGFVIEHDFGGRCRQATITFVGPNESRGYTGNFSSFAGSSDIDVKPVN